MAIHRPVKCGPHVFCVVYLLRATLKSRTSLESCYFPVDSWPEYREFQAAARVESRTIDVLTSVDSL